MHINIQSAVIMRTTGFQGWIHDPIRLDVERYSAFTPIYLLTVADTHWALVDVDDAGPYLRRLRCYYLRRTEDKSGPVFHPDVNLTVDIFECADGIAGSDDPLAALFPDGARVCWRNDLELPEMYDRPKALLSEAFKEVLAMFPQFPAAAICYTEPDLSEPIIQVDELAVWCPINHVWRAPLLDRLCDNRPREAWILRGAAQFRVGYQDWDEEPNYMLAGVEFADRAVWMPQAHGYEPVERLVSHTFACSKSTN